MFWLSREPQYISVDGAQSLYSCNAEYDFDDDT
jgi:hypothetical protein